MDYILLNKLIQIKSTKNHPEKKMEILDLIEKKFSKKLLIKRFDYSNRASMVLSNTKSKKLDLIISTHADVVSAEDKLFQLRNEKGKLYGRGAYDMKSALLASLTALSEAETKKKVAVFVTTDEEVDGLSTKLLLEKVGYSADFAIIPDGGSLNNLVNCQKGFLQIKLTFVGKSSHASEPWKGVNALDLALSASSKIKNDFPNPKKSTDWKTTLCLTKIFSGESLNQIPATAELFMDIRFVPSESISNIVCKIKKSCPNNTKVEIIASNNAFSVNQKIPEIEKLGNIISTLTKKKVNYVNESSTSDAIYFADFMVPAILFRPIGGNMHSDNEYVDQASLEKFYQIILEFINNED